MNTGNYLAIAEIIRYIKEEVGEGNADLTFDFIEQCFTEMLKDNDPNFDHVLFLNDCEIVEGEEVSA